MRSKRRLAPTLAVVLLLAVAAAVLVTRQPEQVLPGPPDAGDWPVLARYTETRVDEPAYEWEVGARGWTSWTMVRSDGLALQRDGDDRWVGTAFFLDDEDRETPFDRVEGTLAGRWADRHLVAAAPDVEEEWVPLDGFEPEPATAADVLAGRLADDDLPGLRAEVADRLGLDPDALVAFAAEDGQGARVTWVRDAGTGVPLHHAADGVVIGATDVRFEADLPEPRAPDPDVPPGPVEVPVEPEVAAAGQWRTLADAPVAGRQDAGGVWTGAELLVWGGVPRAAGTAYDPAADAWRALPDAPIDSREWHATVWTGAELVVWGGAAYEEPDDPDAPIRGADFVGELRADGAAYDPQEDAWRLLADSPLAPRAGAAAVWTGAELVVVGGTGEGIDPGTTQDFVDGAAYDPAADAWRAIPDLPDDGLREIGRDAVWTGAEMLVGGSRFAPGLAAGYDPDADAWRLIDGSPLAGGGGFVAWTGSEAILTDTMTDSLAAYDPVADAWRGLAPPPVEPIQGVAFVAADGRLLALGGFTGDRDGPMGAWLLAEDEAEEGWAPLGETPVPERGSPVAVWTGEELLVWSGTAVAAGHEAAARDDGAAWRPD